jgi:oligopeptidase B
MSNDDLTPPVAAARPRSISVFGEELTDDYYWLRERENPEVIAHIEAENRYTAAALQHTEPLRQELYQELVARIKEDDESAPAPRGGYVYYERSVTGHQYRVHCRMPRAGGPEEILLDENLLAAGQSYFRMGVFKLSPDQKLLAYATDTNGGERFNLYVKDLETGEIADGPIPNVTYDVEWAADNRTLFYATPNEAWRTSRLFRHVLDTDPAHDPLIYEESDESFDMHLSKTRSGAFLVLHLKSNTTSEHRVLAADNPSAGFRLARPRRHGVEEALHHHSGWFYIQTNDGALNFKVVRVPVDQPDATPEEFVPHQAEVSIDAIELFAGHMAIHEREAGLEQLRVIDLASGAAHRVPFPEPVYTFQTDGPHFNAEFETSVIRLSYSSPVTPPSTYDYDMAAHTLALRKQTEVPGYSPAHYRCERLFASAPDGARVPLTLVERAGTPHDGSAPLYLYAYGSYGATIDPAFDFKRLPLLDRGVIYVIAHIRGGGELGRSWYEDGKLLRKRNTFTDFIASAEHLIEQGYTRPERLVIKGRSAGGLLMGAVVTMRPDLFRAAIAGVPFVDVINTSLDPSIPLVVSEYEEWGDPRIKEQYEYLRSYSPYDNTAARDYPHILATAGLFDPRVQYWEPAKWVQKLRAMKTGRNRVLLKTEMVGGHAGPSGRYDYLKDIAFEYAFLLDSLGMLEAQNI